MVSLVFSMQVAGLIIGPFVTAGLLASGMAHGLASQPALATIPALAVF
jgi:hypothetical protein